MPLLPCNRLLLASGHEDLSPSYAPRFTAFSWEKLCPCSSHCRLTAADYALLIVLEARRQLALRDAEAAARFPRPGRQLGGSSVGLKRGGRPGLGGAGMSERWAGTGPGGEPRGVGIRAVRPKPRSCHFGEDVIAGGIT